MAYRDRALIIDSLGTNWTATNAPAIGVTASVSVSPAQPANLKTRVHLTQLGWSLNNARGAAAATATVSVKAASTAGTVYAAWDIVAAASSGQQDSYAVNIKGKKGVRMFIDTGTPNASAFYKVSAAGWMDTLSDG